ncbi:MAG: HlyD family type I secretion periplasmic adaptor subunit, partial [Rhodobacteraceae bacterium]|nr:HlyD family type I secretion periplasmic adaptor subunit [Paracoccaceae bacterium]
IRRLRLEAEIAGAPDFTVPDEFAARVPAIVASERALLTARQSEYDARVAGASAVAEQAAKELDLLEKMYKREIAPLIEVTRARKANSDAQNQLSEAVTTTGMERATEYSKTQAELASQRQKLKLAQDQLARTVLVAPMRGVVNKLSVTTIGGVVRPGEEILQIIPLDDDLYIEARVKPRDIASVRQGQDAVIKLSAYDYTIWGTLKARVTFISADTFKDERSRAADGDPHYKVTLAVDRSQFTERQKGLEIRPGMQADVELQTGGKTILTYLLKPLYKSSEALRER